MVKVLTDNKGLPLVQRWEDGARFMVCAEWVDGMDADYCGALIDITGMSYVDPAKLVCPQAHTHGKPDANSELPGTF